MKEFKFWYAWIVPLIGGVVLLATAFLIEYSMPYPLTKMAYVFFLYGGFFMGLGTMILLASLAFKRLWSRLEERLPGVTDLAGALAKPQDDKDYERKIYKKWIRNSKYGGFLALKVVEGPYIVELHIPCDIKLMSTWEIAEFRRFITAPYDGEEFHWSPLEKKEKESSGLC